MIKRYEALLSGMSVLLFLLVLFFDGYHTYVAPAPTYDTLAYVSIAEYQGTNNFKASEQECSSQLSSRRPPCNAFPQLLVGYVAGLSDADYNTYLRLYRVKPLFTATITLLHREFHIGSYNAIQLINSSSYILAGIVVWVWLRRHYSVIGASLFSALIMSLPESVMIGKSLTPDALSTFLLIFSAYTLTYNRRVALGIGMFLITALARPDTVIFGCLLVMLLVYREVKVLRQKIMLVGVVGFVSLLVLFLEQKLTGAVPFPTLFVTSFIHFVSPTEFQTTRLSIHQFISADSFYAAQVLLGDLILPLLLCAICLVQSDLKKPNRDLLLASIATSAIRLLLFPDMAERFYVWFLLFAVITVRVAMSRMPGLHPLLWGTDRRLSGCTIKDPDLEFSTNLAENVMPPLAIGKIN